jgi:hypothetical protein
MNEDALASAAEALDGLDLRATKHHADISSRESVHALREA